MSNPTFSPDLPSKIQIHTSDAVERVEHLLNEARVPLEVAEEITAIIAELVSQTFHQTKPSQAVFSDYIAADGWQGDLGVIGFSLKNIL